MSRGILQVPEVWTNAQIMFWMQVVAGWNLAQLPPSRQYSLECSYQQMATTGVFVLTNKLPDSSECLLHKLLNAAELALKAKMCSTWSL